jgi:hypothetical protein
MFVNHDECLIPFLAVQCVRLILSLHLDIYMSQFQFFIFPCFCPFGHFIYFLIIPVYFRNSSNSFYSLKFKKKVLLVFRLV